MQASPSILPKRHCSIQIPDPETQHGLDQIQQGGKQNPTLGKEQEENTKDNPSITSDFRTATLESEAQNVPIDLFFPKRH
jgi:hypothetical protein